MSGTDKTGDRMSERDETEAESAGSRDGLLAGLVIGALFGAGIALLFAPGSGQETRSQLRRRMRTLGKDASQGFERAEAEARRQLRRGRRGLEERMRS